VLEHALRYHSGSATGAWIPENYSVLSLGTTDGPPAARANIVFCPPLRKSYSKAAAGKQISTNAKSKLIFFSLIDFWQAAPRMFFKAL
jgi:hypothetical protein